MDVSDEESDEELSMLTPPDIVNKAKTVNCRFATRFVYGIFQEK
jgi:hypothetical protein